MRVLQFLRRMCSPIESYKTTVYLEQMTFLQQMAEVALLAIHEGAQLNMILIAAFIHGVLYRSDIL